MPGRRTPEDGDVVRSALTGSPLPFGALDWVTCQRAGSTVGSTSVWDRLDDRRWVSDYYISNGSNTTYTSAVPRC